jgi:uracil-DNA glycosylase
MDDPRHLTLGEEITAALDWWREAGVDGDMRDAAQGWMAVAEPEAAAAIAEPVARAARPEPEPAPPASVDRSAWPQDLGAFAAWWLADPWLDEGRTTGRVPPRGITGAELMILVAEPEADDSDELLSGPQGRLLSAMLAAMGIAKDNAYVASVLPRAMPHADWAALAARGLGELACHHIALAAPKRLLVLGSNILPLLGHDPANNSGRAGEFQHGGLTVPMLAARDLALLREKPRWKAAFWQSWLDWTEAK